MACGVSFGIAGVMWMYILKNFPFHQVYPMTAVAYIFGMLASMWVFGESVPPVRWLGVLLIMAGCVFILK